MQVPTFFKAAGEVLQAVLGNVEKSPVQTKQVKPIDTALGGTEVKVADVNRKTAASKIVAVAEVNDFLTAPLSQVEDGKSIDAGPVPVPENKPVDAGAVVVTKDKPVDAGVVAVESKPEGKAPVEVSKRPNLPWANPLVRVQGDAAEILDNRKARKAQGETVPVTKVNAVPVTTTEPDKKPKKAEGEVLPVTAAAVVVESPKTGAPTKEPEAEKTVVGAGVGAVLPILPGPQMPLPIGPGIIKPGTGRKDGKERGVPVLPGPSYSPGPGGPTQVVPGPSTVTREREMVITPGAQVGRPEAKFPWWLLLLALIIGLIVGKVLDRDSEG